MPSICCHCQLLLLPSARACAGTRARHHLPSPRSLTQRRLGAGPRDGGARTSLAAEAPLVLSGTGPWPTAPKEAGAPGGPAQGAARRFRGGTGGSEWRHGGVLASTPANAWI